MPSAVCPPRGRAATSTTTAAHPITPTKDQTVSERRRIEVRLTAQVACAG